jgi:CheY-like chemotaxis protein
MDRGNGRALTTRETPVDVIVADAVVLDADGITLVAELRQREDQTPVVLMSAADVCTSHRPGLRFIPGPVEFDVLSTLVQRTLADDLSVHQTIITRHVGPGANVACTQPERTLCLPAATVEPRRIPACPHGAVRNRKPEGAVKRNQACGPPERCSTE